MEIPNSSRQKLNQDKFEAIGVPDDDINQFRGIPEDVIREILVRLPTQSISGLKLTCKSWYALIRSRSMIELHRRFHRHDDDDHRNKLFFFDEQGEHNYHVDAMNSSSFQCTPVFEVGNLLRALKSVTPVKFRETLIRVAGIDLPLEMIAQVYDPCINVLGPLSNGIFCVVAQVYARTPRTTGVDLVTTYGYSSAAFCNPATGEFQLISPPHVFEHRIKPSHSFALFHDDLPPALARKEYATQVLKVKQHYGFGCAVEKDVVVDYKIVMIMKYSDRYSDWFRVFVYSQRRGVWKLVSDSDHSGSFGFQFPRITQDLDFLPQATNLNGCCHWMTDSILRFYFTSEEFSMIPGPPDEYNNHLARLVKRRGVFVLNDHLAAIVVRYDFPFLNPDYDCHIDVWVMKEYGVKESWTKIESCSFPLGLQLQKFLGMFFSGDISDGSIAIERMFFQTKRGELLSYDCFGRVATKHSISGSRIHKKDSTPSRLKKLYDDDYDDNDDGGGCADDCDSRWDLLKESFANDGYDRSLACWKTVGLSTYVETLEPVALRDME